MIGSFDPPTTAQVHLVETLLSAGYESIRILPAARLRAGMVIEHAKRVHRASLIDLTFGGRPRVEIDFRGLEDELAVAPTTLHQAMDSQTDLWFVVPDEAVSGPENKNDLRNSWEEGEKLWQEGGFIIVTDPGNHWTVNSCLRGTKWSRWRTFGNRSNCDSSWLVASPCPSAFPKSPPATSDAIACFNRFDLYSSGRFAINDRGSAWSTTAATRKFWRPLMMPADAKVRIRTLDHSGKRPVHAFVDGLPAGIANSIEVGRSHVAAVELAFARDSDLSAKLLASLLPHESDEF